MPKRYICTKCDYVGAAAKKKRGSTKVEMVGWFLLFPLGIPYSIWRMVTKFDVCKGCGNEAIIDASTMVGQRLLAKMDERFPDDTPPPTMPERF